MWWAGAKGGPSNGSVLGQVNRPGGRFKLCSYWIIDHLLSELAASASLLQLEAMPDFIFVCRLSYAAEPRPAGLVVPLSPRLRSSFVRSALQHDGTFLRSVACYHGAKSPCITQISRYPPMHDGGTAAKFLAPASSVFRASRAAFPRPQGARQPTSYPQDRIIVR